MQEGLRPWVDRILCLPSLLSVAGEAVNENNAGLQSDQLPVLFMDVTKHGVERRM